MRLKATSIEGKNDIYHEPAALEGQPRRLACDLKQVVIVQELYLNTVNTRTRRADK
jgi:hypothetical protein